MKNKILIFLALTLLTGLIGFTGLSFEGIIGVRVLFLIFADLFVVTLLASLFFPQEEEQEMRPIKVRK